MIIDTTLTFANSSTAMQKAAGTANIGDVIDLQQSGLDIGHGTPMFLIVVVETAAAGGGTTAIRLVSDSVPAPDLTTATVHFTTAAFTNAQLPQGKIYVFPLPSNGFDYERYLGIQAVTATATETALVATVFLSPDSFGWKAYPDNIK